MHESDSHDYNPTISQLQHKKYTYVNITYIKDNLQQKNYVR